MKKRIIPLIIAIVLLIASFFIFFAGLFSELFAKDCTYSYKQYKNMKDITSYEELISYLEANKFAYVFSNSELRLKDFDMIGFYISNDNCKIIDNKAMEIFTMLDENDPRFVKAESILVSGKLAMKYTIEKEDIKYIKYNEKYLYVNQRTPTIAFLILLFIGLMMLIALV